MIDQSVTQSVMHSYFETLAFDLAADASNVGIDSVRTDFVCGSEMCAANKCRGRDDAPYR